MPQVTTLGRELVNRTLPPSYRNRSQQFTVDYLDNLLKEIGSKSGDDYRKITHDLVQLGRNFATTEGVTLKLDDFKNPYDAKAIIKMVHEKEKEINALDIPDDEKEEAIAELYQKAQENIVDNTYKKALEKNNPLALQVMAKARGNKNQLAQIIATPSTYQDSNGKTLPIFIGRSYAEGLTPAEFYASTHGARIGVVSTKFATRDAGYLGKQLATAAADLIVTEKDCGTQSAMPVDIDDNDNVGSVLSRDTGAYPAGTVVTSKVIADLKKKGYDKLLLRSPITCGAAHGVCQVCAGKRENGEFPQLRDHIGIQAGSALVERIAQGSLNVKHQGGKKDTSNRFSGFKFINQFTQVPENFAYQATVSTKDGTVDKIEELPQGGWNIVVDGEKHYVDPEEQVLVKEGDKMEAGDQMSTGLLNPAQVVKYKGLGEGRKYFTDRLTQMFKDSKLKVNRRNMEVVTRAIMDTVKVDDPEGMGDMLPGEYTSYNSVARSYTPRSDAKNLPVENSKGFYLEQPVLHYTIGTRVTKKVGDELKKYGIKEVKVHPDKPQFDPVMIQLWDVPNKANKDWVARLQGSYLKDKMLNDVQTGAVSNIHGTNPYPGLAYGVEFGKSKKDKVTF